LSFNGGINGSEKTQKLIGKLAQTNYQYTSKESDAAAGDTFRAAAGRTITKSGAKR